MKLHQKIRINESGTEVINTFNLGEKHKKYTGTIIAKDIHNNFLVEIDQVGVDTFKTATIFVEEPFYTEKAFCYLTERDFERV